MRLNDIRFMSNLKFITSGNIPTVDDLPLGNMAFGEITSRGRSHVYGNINNVIVDLCCQFGTGGEQELKILKGKLDIGPKAEYELKLNCGYTAYELKTIRFDNITNSENLIVFIYDNMKDKNILYQSLAKTNIYSNTADVVNIDENSDICICVVNTSNANISVIYDVRVVSFKDGGIYGSI